MFGKIKNEAILSFDIVTDSPLYIRTGDDNSLDPSAVDGSYMSIFRNGKYEPFIPGTSLKGAFRSRAERMLRSDDDKGACNILGKDEAQCVCKKDGKHMDAETRYIKSCPVCRLFGSNVLKSRVTFGDAYVNGEYKIGKRTCVAIDRITGAAKKNALYDMEYVESGSFAEKIRIQNFERYQIKLLLCLIDEMNEGFLTLGGLSSKGFGCVKTENVKLTLRYYSNDDNIEKQGYSKELYYYNKTVEGLDEIKKVLSDIKLNDLKRGDVVDGKAI